MGNLIVTLMDRKHTRTLTPCTFVHKYNHYGVNNAPFSADTEDCSGVYRMNHFPDDIFDRLSHVYYYKTGNAVSNLKSLCAKRGEVPAVAFRPVERVEAVFISEPHQSQLQQEQRKAEGEEEEPPRMVPRSVTHYGERVVLSYAALWSAIEHFGVGLHSLLDASRSLLQDTRSTPLSNGADSSLRKADNTIGGGGAGENYSVDTADESHAHIPSRPRHAYERAPVRGMTATKIAIYEETRWEWIATIFGLWTQQCVAVTVYANLGEEALAYALEEAASEVIVCNGKHVPVLFQLMQKARVPWSSIVYLDDLPSDFTVDTSSEDGRRLEKVLRRWTAVVESGRALSTMGKATAEDDDNVTEAKEEKKEERYHAPLLPASNDHLALIMYTSGTTGKPKGVMHTHGSIAAGIETLNDKLIWIEPSLPKENQTYCALLPLAHVLEFVCVNIFLHRGFLVCLSNPRTLTSEFTRPHGDFEEYKPLVIMAVPRVFDILRKSVLAGLPATGTLKRRIFDQAFASRREALRRGYDTPYYNAKVFAKVRAAFGGRMVLMLSGGGLLCEVMHEFVNVAMGLVVEAYGLTESCACGATQMIGSLEYNNCGQLVKACEVKLLDTEQFTHTDVPEPRGEILMRGPFMFKGYYKQPELTKEVLDDDGFFHTGDLGAISTSANNTLRIIGRIKALAKNSLGEYIPMEALESIYCCNDLSLPNSTSLLVHPHRNYVCALVLTEKKLVVNYLAKHPELVQELRGATEFPVVLSNPIFQAAAAASFRETAVEAKRQPLECVRHVRLLADCWTAENGMLTAALKIRRAAVEEKYAGIISELFAED